MCTPRVYRGRLIAGSVTRVGKRGRFHVLNEGSGAVGAKKMGIRVRRMRTTLGRRLSIPFLVASTPSRGFKRVVMLLTRKRLPSSVRRAYARRLPPC